MLPSNLRLEFSVSLVTKANEEEHIFVKRNTLKML